MLVVLAMLSISVVPAQAQTENAPEQDLPTVTIQMIADQLSEGSHALIYRLVSDPAPSDDLVVRLELDQIGTYVIPALPGEFNLTIPAGQSMLDFGIPTLNDAMDEADGSITLTVNPLGTAYQVGDDNSATVEVVVNVANAEEPGEVRFSSVQPNVGVKYRASLNDPDGSIGSTAWVWARADSASGPFTDISGAMASEYTPTSDDVGRFLRISVAYSDGEGPDKGASVTSSEAVLGGRCEFDAPKSASTTLRVQLGGSVTSHFCDVDDDDWIAISLTASQAYRIQITHPHDQYSPRIAGVYDADSQLVTGTHSYTGNPFAPWRPRGTINFRATATSTYYVEVEPTRCCIPPRLDLPERYDVTLAESDAPPDDVPTVQEVLLEFDRFGYRVAEIHGSVETEGDRDTYMLNVKAGHRYTIKMPPSGDPGMFNCIHGIASASTPDQPGPNSRECVHRPAYSIIKWINADADDQLLITVGSDEGIGSYRLLFRDLTSVPPTAYNTPLPESDTASDTTTTGRVYINDSWINGTTVVGEIDLAYDKDWYRVDLAAGERYQIDILGEASNRDNGTPGNLRNPYLWLYDNNGQRIEGTFDDDSGWHLEPRLVYIPTRTGTYYIAVAASGREIGTYAVSVIDLKDYYAVHRPQEDN